MADETFSVTDFGASFHKFLENVNATAQAPESPFATMLTNHFGRDPRQLPVVSEEFGVSEHVNLQLALEAYLSENGRTSKLVGLSDAQSYRGVGFSEMLTASPYGMVTEGPVEYLNLAAGQDREIAAVQRGLFEIAEGEKRLAVLVNGPNDHSFRRRLSVDVMAAERAEAETFLRQIRQSMRKRNVYRGQIVSLSVDDSNNLQVHFHRLPEVPRERIVFPSGLLERIERTTIGFARVADQLREAGRHLKRGLLLHGAPGTGKTLTAMYLASRMKDRTILLLTGRSLGLIEASCRMARMLQPATLILEDVDLIAEERTRPGQTCGPILFELLNQMDGLADDADILFLLTTNRPEILEPALASRPGRVDQAVEVPLPDADSRRRLIELYATGLTMRVENVDQIVRRTDGVSAAFIRELLRRAALIASDRGSELVVTDRDLDEALHELIVTGGALTRSLLGAGAQAGNEQQ